MKWFHRHHWTVTGVTAIRRYKVNIPDSAWPGTEVLQVCDCGECRTVTLDGSWTLDQLQPTTTLDKDTLKRMGIKL